MNVVVSHPDESISIGTDPNQQTNTVQEQPETTVINIQDELNYLKYKKYIYICLIIDLCRFFLYPNITIFFLLNFVSGMFCFRGLQTSSNWMIWIYGFYHLFEGVLIAWMMFLYPSLTYLIIGIISIIFDICCFDFVRKYIKEQPRD